MSSTIEQSTARLGPRLLSYAPSFLVVAIALVAVSGAYSRPRHGEPARSVPSYASRGSDEGLTLYVVSGVMTSAALEQALRVNEVAGQDSNRVSIAKVQSEDESEELTAAIDAANQIRELLALRPVRVVDARDP